MKTAFFALTALVFVSGVSAFADTASDLEAKAQAAYEARDYSSPGMQSAQQASDLFAQAANATADANKKAECHVRQAGAVFFLGQAENDNAKKMNYYWTAYTIANDVTAKTYQIADVTQVSDAQAQTLAKLPADQLTLLGEALYVRGISLGQWGNTNGVMESLNKWPDLKADMELMVRVGLKQLHQYGAYRTLGRGLFKIPALLGGDVAKATKYLQAAVQGSLAPGQTFSIDGYNNLFYADILKDAGKDAEAKKLLQDYIAAAQTNPNILPGYVPETKEAVREAIEMLKSW